MKKRVRINVKGFVQGVGYRYFCYRKAVEFNITGYAKNLIDGSVVIAAEGDADIINDFIEELKKGPRNSKVNSVNIEELTFKNEFSDFEIY